MRATLRRFDSSRRSHGEADAAEQPDDADVLRLHALGQVGKAQFAGEHSETEDAERLACEAVARSNSIVKATAHARKGLGRGRGGAVRRR